MGFPPPPLGSALARAAVRGAVDHGGGAALRRGGQRARPPRKPQSWRPDAAAPRHFSASTFFPRPQAVVAPRSWAQALRSALSHIAPTFRAAARSYATAAPSRFTANLTSSISKHSAHLARNAPRQAFHPLHSAPRFPRAPALRPSLHHGPGLQPARNFSSGQRVFSDAVINAPLLLRAAADELDDHKDDLRSRIGGRGVAKAGAKGKGKASAPIVIRPAFSPAPCAGVRRSGFKTHAQRQRKLATGAYVYGSIVLRDVSLAEAEELARARLTLAPASTHSNDASDEASTSDGVSDIVSEADTLAYSDVFVPVDQGEIPDPPIHDPFVHNRRRGPHAGITTQLLMPAQPETARLASRPRDGYDSVLAGHHDDEHGDALEHLITDRFLAEIAHRQEEARAHLLRFVIPVQRLLEEINIIPPGGSMRYVQDDDDGDSTKFKVDFPGFTRQEVGEMFQDRLEYHRAQNLMSWMSEIRVGDEVEPAEPATPRFGPAVDATNDEDETRTIHASSPEALGATVMPDDMGGDDFAFPSADSLHLGASFLTAPRDVDAGSQTPWSSDGSDDSSSLSSADLPSDWSALDGASSGSGSDEEWAQASRSHGRGLPELLRGSVVSLSDSSSESEGEELYDSRLV